MSHLALTVFFGFSCLTAAAPAQFQDTHIFVGSFDGVVYEVDPAGYVVSIFADTSDGLSGTSAVAFTPEHTLLTSNYSTSQVIEFDASGVGTVVLDSIDGLNGPFGANGIAISQSGQVFVANYDDSRVLRFQSDYSGGTVFADSGDWISSPDGLAFVAGGDLMVANRNAGGTVLRIAPDGTTTVFDKIPFENCYSAAVRNNGDLYIACYSGNVYRYVGGVPGGRVYLGTYGMYNIAIEFNPGHSVLYVVTTGDASLWKVDPDSGSGTVVATGFPNAAGIAVFGSECPPGGFTEYGSGLAGSGGFVPALHGIGHAAPVGSVTIEVRDFVGSAECVLFCGIAPGSSSAFGGTLYVSLGGPSFLFPFTLPGGAGVPGEGDLDLTETLPSNPALRCMHIYLQALATDAGAVKGVALSNALEMFIGD